MKTPDAIVAVIRRRLENTWSHVVEAEIADTTHVAGPGNVYWSAPLPLGKVTQADADRDFPAIVAAVTTWRDWAAAHEVTLTWEQRRLRSTPQQVPTHLHVSTLDTAARLAGGVWPERISRARTRAALLAERYPHLVPTADEAEAGLEADDSDASGHLACDGSTGARTRQVTLRRFLTALDTQTDTDVDLLCRAADWFAGHSAIGLTPRQVPIEGLHAKWLNTRQHLVRAAAGVADLGLLPDHPGRIHFTYLDPAHRTSGGRWHDSATVGDHVTPAYTPRVVVISENKDTALYFPQIPGGISVEGEGRGGTAIASFGWITQAEHVIYWGDMDADGLEILDGFRAAGIAAKSLLMDLESYEQYERFGTNHDKNNKPLTERTPRPVEHLADNERALYRRLCDPHWQRHRRIEQERIPLEHAAARLASLISRVAPDR